MKAAAANVLDAKHHPIIAIGGVSCYGQWEETCRYLQSKNIHFVADAFDSDRKRMPAYKNRSKSYTASRHNTGFGCSAATGERRKKASMISCLVRPSKQTMALSCRRCGIPEISCRRCGNHQRTYRRCSNRRYTNQSIQHKGERQWQMRDFIWQQQGRKLVRENQDGLGAVRQNPFQLCAAQRQAACKQVASIEAALKVDGGDGALYLAEAVKNNTMERRRAKRWRIRKRPEQNTRRRCSPLWVAQLPSVPKPDSACSVRFRLCPA